ncbi:MAG TPA: metal-dependent transcriptional regulator [Thermoplasmata archaeon]|nr:metal-dependent transcriptional regulator [Thermoplasmata archaeon]
MVTQRYEEYLEAILTVEQRKGYAKVTDVAELMSVSPAATTEMFKRLSSDGYVNYERYSGVTLTEEGRRMAESLSVKHHVLREFLEILGMDGRTADEEACKIEHVVRPETMDLLTRFVEFIETREKPRWLEVFKRYVREGVLEKCPGRCAGEGGDDAAGGDIDG